MTTTDVSNRVERVGRPAVRMTLVTGNLVLAPVGGAGTRLG